MRSLAECTWVAELALSAVTNSTFSAAQEQTAAPLSL